DGLPSQTGLLFRAGQPELAPTPKNHPSRNLKTPSAISDCLKITMDTQLLVSGPNQVIHCWREFVFPSALTRVCRPQRQTRCHGSCLLQTVLDPWSPSFACQSPRAGSPAEPSRGRAGVEPASILGTNRTTD